MSNFHDQNDSGFDKRTLLAIVLMVAVVTVGMTVQNVFFPRPQPAPAQTQRPAATPSAAPAAAAPVAAGPAVIAAPEALPEGFMLPEAPVAERRVTVETELFVAELSNRGGELVSLKLKDHLDEGRPVELLLAGPAGVDGLSVALGGPGSAPIRELMNVSQPAEGVVEFSRVFFYRASSGELVPYTYRKRFEFKDGDYMFRLAVGFENSRAEALPLGDGTYAYTLTLGPQIGPRFDHLAKNADFRRIVTLENNKRKVINPKGGSQTLAIKPSWAAVAGKYFAFIALPQETPAAYTFVNVAADGRPVTTAMKLSQAPFGASAQTDVYHFYAGPKSARVLASYDDPTANGFGRTMDNLEGVLEGGNMLGWLETLLKWSMNFFYGIVRNYGVAIILVTLLVRLVMFPLTFKGSKATARMQELQPKIQELQAKYKNNPQKLNIEMAEFYKREGYNPLSGCLPLLIQFPIFIAMYSLFNNHFDLRGASFIPGWIDDLSLPEAVFSFPTVNLVIWQLSAIRVLPVIYLVSQLLYGKFMQTPNAGAQSQGQMKFMMYGMPIIFFFVLYDVPSGLLVYWIASNLLTIVQQAYIHRVVHKKAVVSGEAPANGKVIAGKGPKSVKNGRK